MRRHYGDWVIDVVEIEHPNYGRGFRADFYIPKTDGTKEMIREFGDYTGRIKTHQQMMEIVKQIILAL